MLLIRQYIDSDLDAVVTLWYRSWTNVLPNLTHPQPFEEWKTRFQNDYSTQGNVWIATIQARAVGFVSVSNRALAQIFVQVETQGCGVGTVLLNHAKTLSPSGLRLTTLQQNKWAYRFYEKYGFIAGAVGVNPVNRQPNIEYYWKL